MEQRALLLIQVASTLCMVGVIWFVQVVHYPLFNRVGPEAFRAYEAAHTGLISIVVMPLMLAEAITAAILVFNPPAQLAPVPLWIGLGLVVLIWGSTFFVQVPLHGQLSGGFDENAYRALVNTNWIRTIAWTLRGGLVLWMITQFI